MKQFEVRIAIRPEPKRVRVSALAGRIVRRGGTRGLARSVARLGPDRRVYYRKNLIRVRRNERRIEKPLWIVRSPGLPPNELPSLEQVANLTNANKKRWAEVLRVYGLPANSEQFRMKHWPDFHWPDGDLLRISLVWLQGLARQAAFLKACEQAVIFGELAPLKEALDDVKRLSSPSAFTTSPYEILSVFPTQWLGTLMRLNNLTWPNISDDAALLEFGRKAIGLSLEAAVYQLKPVMHGTRGVPGEWSFHSAGWWPLLVLNRYLYRSQNMPSVTCAARNCSRLVPPGRRKFCSERCRQREKKRRQRVVA